MVDLHSKALADLRGAPGALGVQILSFTCNFQQIIRKIIRFWELAHPPGENPRSTTVKYFGCVTPLSPRGPNSFDLKHFLGNLTKTIG